MGGYSLCLLGGTFDRLHVGHHHLIRSLLDHSEQLQVWMSSDEMTSSKDDQILAWERRREELGAWVEMMGFSERVTIHSLEDGVGPAPTDEEATAIGCTLETEAACHRINEMRSDNNLAPLTVITIDHFLDREGKVISSSRIRAGEIDRSGEAWLGESEMYLDQRMPEVLDEELKQPFGTLHEGSEERAEVAMRKALDSLPENVPKVIAVGDVVVHTMQGMGVIPDIAFVDGMTKRTAWNRAEELDRSAFPHLSTCINPPGLITADLKLATRVALSNSRPTLVAVTGEEDLAPIVVHLLAPLGSAVLYGQPGRGVVVRITSEETKRNCRRLLDVFTREV